MIFITMIMLKKKTVALASLSMSMRMGGVDPVSSINRRSSLPVCSVAWPSTSLRWLKVHRVQSWVLCALRSQTRGLRTNNMLIIIQYTYKSINFLMLKEHVSKHDFLHSDLMVHSTNILCLAGDLLNWTGSYSAVEESPSGLQSLLAALLDFRC